jgi:hypothetical protein
MADPWEQYLAPPTNSASSSDDPWAQYVKPAASAQAPAAPAAPMNWKRLLGLAWGGPTGPSDISPDLSGQQAGKSLQQAADVGRVAIGQIPFGGKLVDAAGAEQRLASTPMAGAGEVLGGAGLGVGGEAMGIGRGIAKAVTPGVAAVTGAKVAPWVASGIGGAAEQGGIGALGAIGQGQDPTQAAGIGGAIGAVTGPFGRLRLPAKPDIGPSAAELTAATKKAFQPLDDISASYDYMPPINKVWGGYSQGTQDLATSTKAIVQDINDNPMMSMAELERARKRLATAGQRGSLEDQLIAPKVANALNNFIETGPAWNAAAARAAAPGEAAAARAAGNLAHGREMDAERLAQMQDIAARGGTGVGPAAQDWRNTQAGLRYSPTGSPTNEAWAALGQMPGNAPSAAPSPWDLRHLAYPVLGGIGGAIVGRNEDPAKIAEEVAIGLIGGYGLHRGAPYLKPAMWDRAAVQAAARKTLTEGVPFRPKKPSQSLFDALRALSAYQGAQGRY